jgi:hypothetical protein
VSSILHSRLLATPHEPLRELLGDLMGVLCLVYLGSEAAAEELHGAAAPVPSAPIGQPLRADLLSGLEMRLTYRTLLVLRAIARHPGASNRELAERAGVRDQGQMSKLLRRLADLELAHNRGGGQRRGTSNAWYLTAPGAQLERETSA